MKSLKLIILKYELPFESMYAKIILKIIFNGFWVVKDQN